MKKADIKSLEVYFDDPRLKMTIPGRMFVRAGAYVGYLVWIAATGTFILSDLGWLRALGVFFALVLSVLAGVVLWLVYYISFERKAWKGP